MIIPDFFKNKTVVSVIAVVAIVLIIWFAGKAQGKANATPPEEKKITDENEIRKVDEGQNIASVFEALDSTNTDETAAFNALFNVKNIENFLNNFAKVGLSVFGIPFGTTSFQEYARDSLNSKELNFAYQLLYKKIKAGSKMIDFYETAKDGELLKKTVLGINPNSPKTYEVVGFQYATGIFSDSFLLKVKVQQGSFWCDGTLTQAVK